MKITEMNPELKEMIDDLTFIKENDKESFEMLLNMIKVLKAAEKIKLAMKLKGE